MSASLRDPRPVSERSSAFRMRRDLQGLRAFGVVVVIATHVWGVPAGGHVTVDMFFVISGFLITGLLLREQSRTGRISLAAFFRRRVARLLPAATVVGVLTIAFSALMFSTGRLRSVVGDGWWAAILLENWHLVDVRTDYFTANGPVSPFQHYWSLSVEEQFYLVWPVLIVVAFSVVVRSAGAASSGSERVALAAACGLLAAITVASWVWSLHESSVAPTTAYFSTLDRAWEIGTGALIAFGLRTWERLDRRFGTSLLWLGVVGLAVSMMIVPEDRGFPAPWGTLPVLSTGAVIIGGANAAVRVPVFLANRVTDYIGGLSYSLYLCHFPVLVLLRSVDPMIDWLTLPICAVLAVSVHHAVELPGLRCSWRRGRSAGRVHQPYAHPAAGLFLVIGLTVVAVLTSTLALAAVRPREALPMPRAAGDTAPLGAPRVGADSDVEGREDDAGDTDATPAVSALQTQLTRALAATSWPELHPAADAAQGGATTAACGRLEDPLPLPSCTFGPPDAPVTMMLVGDSTAAYLAESLVDLAKDPTFGVQLVTRTAWSCSFADLPLGPVVSEECVEYRERTMADVERLRPDVLVIMNTFGTIEVADHSTMSVGAWSKSVSTFAARADTAAGSVVHLSPPPPGPDPEECIRPGASPENCVASSTGIWSTRWTAVQSLTARLHQTAIDLRPLVCVGTRCPAFAGNTLIRFDGVHLSPTYAHEMAPGLRELLDPVVAQVSAAQSPGVETTVR